MDGGTRGAPRRSRADARALDGDDGVSRIRPATRDDDDDDTTSSPRRRGVFSASSSRIDERYRRRR